MDMIGCATRPRGLVCSPNNAQAPYRGIAGRSPCAADRPEPKVLLRAESQESRRNACFECDPEENRFALPIVSTRPKNTSRVGGHSICLKIEDPPMSNHLKFLHLRKIVLVTGF